MLKFESGELEKDHDEETRPSSFAQNRSEVIQEQAIRKYLKQQSITLNKQQDILLKKLIHFDSLILDHDND